MQEFNRLGLVNMHNYLTLAILLSITVICNADAAWCKEVPSANSKPVNAQQQSPVELHLIYFRIEGTHCPICLARMNGYIRNADGIEMSEVSFHLPIEAVVIYDRKKININLFFDNIAKVENVKFVDVQDTVISELPKFIRPRPHKIESLLNPYIMP